MDAYRLRVKVGPHEFEAEGPKEEVTAQFEAWKSLISSLPPVPPIKDPPHPPASPDATRNQVEGPPRDKLLTVFSLDDKRGLVTLRALPTGDRRYSDAILLILYGYRRLRDQDELLVTQLKAALSSSGLTPPRIDRIAEPDRQGGLLIKSGAGKGGKYRLTNRGFNQAGEMVTAMLGQLT